LIPRLTAIIRRWRKKVSRSRWAAENIGPGTRGADGIQPGIVLIQIDGLGYDQFIRAMRHKRLPFLKRLLGKEDHVLRRFYSGLPSSTPAVQAELFFGVRSAVPAFHYIDRVGGGERIMFDPQAVRHLAAVLEKREAGLLAGGTGYGNILVGGAEEARFCIQGMDLQSIFHWRHPLKTLFLIITHLDAIFRICGLALLETLLAVVDFFRGLINRKNILKELRFIASRIGVCIVLRELLRLHVKMDIAAGVPIIQANFVGYDEHAHRRGPSSAFAHWTLKGIDKVIRDIAKSAARSDRLQYQIIVFSDHGQEAVSPFEKVFGETVQQAVARVFATGPLAGFSVRPAEGLGAYANLHMRAIHLLKKTMIFAGPAAMESSDKDIRMTAMGPLGHLYLPIALSARQMDEYARGLVMEGKIPLVIYKSDIPWAMTEKGKVDLRWNQRLLEEEGHPFAEQIQEDLLRICLHQDSGDFIISGWRQGERTLSFPIENGAHGGPGRHETCGFLILSDFLARHVDTFRPAVLRKKIMAFRHAPVTPGPHVPAGSGGLRLVTYNIHSCIGMDGRVLPERIARIIGRLAPDIVCLQEVDRGMERSGGRDQAAELARSLGMKVVFLPLRRAGAGEYGIAVLSRLPCTIIKSAPFSILFGRRRKEKRGAIWLEVSSQFGPVLLVNTHLGLTARERRKQLDCLFGEDWLADRDGSLPLVVCGDFNAGFRSLAYRRLTAELADARAGIGSTLPATFSSIRPLLHLDHIFHSSHFRATAVQVRRSTDCRLASDHLPLFVELKPMHASKKKSSEDMVKR
jgi:endonuclease/exonuclease/phosphatase family metal-dependent hydrolase